MGNDSKMNDQREEGTAGRNPILIKDREESIFMLSEAATLEHMVMVQYLFASFSLKRRTKEGVTPEQLKAIRRWNQNIVEIAEQEMLHLALVNNLLTSIGAAPYLGRPNFPLRSRYFPSGVTLALLPFDEVSLRFFLYLERPETVQVEDVPGFVKDAGSNQSQTVVPQGQEFATIGQLYRGIELGLEHLVDSYGESQLLHRLCRCPGR